MITWGADAVKIGIGGGGACSTKNKTGFHVPMFTCVELASQESMMARTPAIPIIADGGIRENGDVSKAIAAGAHMVMAGSIFAACEDGPAENVMNFNEDKITHKKYFGSASAKNKGENKHVEGFEVYLPCNAMTYAQKLQEIKEDLQSSVSYAGGKDLEALRNVSFVEV